MNKSHIHCGVEIHCKNVVDPWIIMKESRIDFSGKAFHVIDSLVFSNGKLSSFPKAFHSVFFQEMIDSCCCAERLVVHLYKEDVLPEKIDDYFQYQNSLCEMVLLICDGYYFEVYAKDTNWLEEIKTTAENISVIELYDKYEDEDPRTGFYV